MQPQRVRACLRFPPRDAFALALSSCQFLEDLWLTYLNLRIYMDRGFSLPSLASLIFAVMSLICKLGA